VTHHLVFDAAQQPLDLTFVIGGLFLPVPLLGLWLKYYAAIHVEGVVGKDRLRTFWLLSVLGLLAYGLYWILVGGTNVLQYDRVQHTLQNGTASVVEGTVEDFHPMPPGGHDTERFTVNGVHFAYVDYDPSPGFHQANAHGGPIHEGLPVRIHYVGPATNATILQLEIGEQPGRHSGGTRTTGGYNLVGDHGSGQHDGGEGDVHEGEKGLCSASLLRRPAPGRPGQCEPLGVPWTAAGQGAA
jgi:hypothetical protein